MHVAFTSVAATPALTDYRDALAKFAPTRILHSQANSRLLFSKPKRKEDNH